MSALRMLYAEDNEADVVLARECLVDCEIEVDLHHVWNGRECLSFLRKEGDYGDAPDVDVVLLDLKMPVMTGLEFLERLRADEKLCGTPVVMFTTSPSPHDVQDGYDLRCSGYIQKPVEFPQFRAMMKSFTRYWSEVMTVPRDVKNPFSGRSSRN